MATRTTDVGAHGRFDAFELAAAGTDLAGEIDARSLPRVADQLAEGANAAPITWRISGGHDDAGRPSLRVRLDGVVPLVCQRCLQPFGATVAQQTDLLLPESMHGDALVAEDTEVVLANTTLDPRNLVEDELLLSLPLSPRHDEEACAAARRSMTDDGKRSPFAGLAALKARNPD
jgi:uncharacterized protein